MTLDELINDLNIIRHMVNAGDWPVTGLDDETGEWFELTTVASVSEIREVRLS